MRTVFTIGYSRRPQPDFIALLVTHDVRLLCDVRSAPNSRFRPEFGRERLAAALASAGIDYRYHGDRLGGRPRAPDCFVGGKLSYSRTAAQAFFRDGLDTVRESARAAPLALMCAEADPIDCHRAMLVARHLRTLVDEIRHIGRDDRVESLDAFERRLVARTGTAPPPLLAAHGESWARAVDDAYDRRSEKLTGVK